MYLLRRALGLPPSRPQERLEDVESDELPDDPNTDMGDDDTQECER